MGQLMNGFDTSHLGWLGGLLTAGFMASFVGWTWWAYAPSNAKRHEESGRMPLEGGDL